LGIGNWELGIGNWELGIGHLSDIYLDSGDRFQLTENCYKTFLREFTVRSVTLRRKSS
jgi:hypothetical protein